MEVRYLAITVVISLLLGGCLDSFARNVGKDIVKDVGWQIGGDQQLLILGKGPARQELETFRDRLGSRDRVTMPGHTMYPWGEPAASRAFLMPSRWEGLPNAALEALAMAIPVNATATFGGPAELGGLVKGDMLTITDSDDAFKQAMSLLVSTERDGEALPPSVLPGLIDKPNVVTSYSDLIARMVA